MAELAARRGSTVDCCTYKVSQMTKSPLTVFDRQLQEYHKQSIVSADHDVIG
jgi:hypothetical protein